MNAAGTVVVEYTYDAWGNVLSVTGSQANTIGQYNPFRYRSYYYDTETGFCYLQSRYYDPVVGRFLNADGIVGANGGIEGYNMFAYCNNNPVVFSDDSGYAMRPNTVIINDGGSATPQKDSIRDVTDEVDLALHATAEKAQMTLMTRPALPIEFEIGIYEMYYEFYSLVNHRGPWDIKNPDSWEKTIGTEYPGKDTPVIYHGKLMTTEKLGNYTYGFIGISYGIPLNVLYLGSYYAAGFPTEGELLDNEINKDWPNISDGFYDGLSFILGIDLINA